MSIVGNRSTFDEPVRAVRAGGKHMPGTSAKLPSLRSKVEAGLDEVTQSDLGGTRRRARGHSARTADLNSLR